jgi:CheY-like chemotaxis protein
LDVRGIHHPTQWSQPQCHTPQKVRCRSWPAAPIVLIVDDEPSVRRSLSRMLQAQGFHCLEASSGRQALQVLEKTGEIPLIISDMKMPELDGMAFLEVVRRQVPRQLGHHAERHE